MMKLQKPPLVRETSVKINAISKFKDLFKNFSKTNNDL